MKYVKLLGEAFINGNTVRPDDGVQIVTDDVADHLIAVKLAEDVTAEFAEQAPPAPESGAASGA